MVEVGVYGAFRDAEDPQAFNKVAFAFARNNDFVEHIFIAYVLQPFEGIVDGEIGLLGILFQNRKARKC